MSKKNRNLNEYQYDKYSEHLDQTPLGKLQQQYWTTKQQVIKKLGKKEDEFVVLSDAELDAKLELFEAIGKSSMELLKVIEMYQEKLIVLSIEEGEMSSFLKSQSTYDTKTKAGKMMAAVAKAQHFAAQQHTTLRLPLVRLYNEVETFRYRAFTDTFVTVRKMEQSRTEYRGALLWMKNVSMELDPDATRKLEKFRRVQAQVKKTKSKFDRLKSDAIQKIDLLSTSRCNMFSHVLVNYQRTLLQFWEKTARTFNAVADSFKGYQYYEFNIIKDLVEPSKRLAEIVNKESKEINKNEEKQSNDETKGVDNSNTLINFDGEDTLDEKKTDKGDDDDDDLIDNKSLDKVNELIDLLTLNEAHSINEQLRELEQLEEEKKKRNNTNNNNSNSKEKSESIKLLNDSKFTFDFSAASISKIFSRSTTETSATMPTTTKSPNHTDLVDLDFDHLNNSNSQSPNVLNSFRDLLNSKNDEFEREWQSAFGTSSTKQTSDEFGQFVTATPPISGSNSSNEMQSLFSAHALLRDQQQQPVENKPLLKLNENEKSLAQKASNSTTNNNNNKNMSAWYDLFAELDPLKNPDAIGNTTGLEDERNC